VDVFSAAAPGRATQPETTATQTAPPPAPEQKSSVASKLADILNKRRQNVKVTPGTQSQASNDAGELVTTVPIQINDAGEIFSVDFQLFTGRDPASQAQEFCNKFNLQDEHCEALISRSFNELASFMQKKKQVEVKPPTISQPEPEAEQAVAKSSVAAKLADILKKRRKGATSTTPSVESKPPSTPPVTPSSTREVLDTIQIQIQDGEKSFPVEFSLFSDMDPVSQAQEFCTTHDLMADHCDALKTRAMASYASETTQADAPPTPGAMPGVPKSSVAAKLADILNKRRQSRKPAASVDVKPAPAASTTSSAELIETIPIQLQAGADTYGVEFQLYSSSDSQSQAEVFCKQHDLTAEHCQMLINRANEAYAEAQKGRMEESSVSKVLLESISVRLEYEDDIIDTNFKLFNSPDPTTQAKTFCREYDLSDAYCEALTQRAVDVFSAAAPGRATQPETTATQTAPPPAPEQKSSVASKLADILKKRRKPTLQDSSSQPAAAAGNVIDVIPIRMEYEDETVDIEFKLYDNAEPRRQAQAFCMKHDLVAEYCEALTARAEFLYSNR